MWRRQRIAFQDHVTYINNYTPKPFRVIIIQSEKCVFEMHYISKYLPPTSKKGDLYHQEDWRLVNRDLTEYNICVDTKDVPSQSMYDETEDKYRYYYNLSHESWCDLLSTLDAKENSNGADAQIKRISRHKYDPEYSSEEILRVPHKRKAITGVLKPQKSIRTTPQIMV